MEKVIEGSKFGVPVVEGSWGCIGYVVWECNFVGLGELEKNFWRESSF